MSTKPFTLRLTPELTERLVEEAKREGVPPATLAAEWIRDRLNHSPRVLLAEALVVIIAALSEQLDKDSAEAIVREHFLEGKTP